MWLPLTRRTIAAELEPATRPMMSVTHGPAALTRQRRAKVPRLRRSTLFLVVTSTAVAFAPRARRRAVRVSTIGALFGGIDRVEHDEARIVHPAIGIFEALGVLVEDRRAFGIAGEIERAGARQLLAAAEMVVEEQAEPHQPGRAILGAVRQHEAHRPDDVRRGLEQHFALDQRLAHQPEFVIFEIAQAAMHQLAGARRGALGKVVLLAEDHRQAAAGRVARDAGAVDAAADHEEINPVTSVVIFCSSRIVSIRVMRPRALMRGRPRRGLTRAAQRYRRKSLS